MHRIFAINCSRLFFVLIPAGQCGAQSAPGITRSRLNPDILERTFTQDSAVGDTVERDTSSHAKVVGLVFTVNGIGQSQHHLFGDLLDRARYIHFLLCDFRFTLARGTTKKFVEPPIGHGQTGSVVEVTHIQAKSAVFLQVQQVVENQINIPRLSIGCQAHQLVFT